ncbi:MAG: AgmX/PglI C-terminal domain-containing protein, partial [candidate division WOR-3 bacterium]
FVAMDSEVRNTDGSGVTVKQPLPLPQGVSDLAVGGAAQYGLVPRLAAKLAPLGTNDSIALKERKGVETGEKPASSVEKVIVSGGLTREAVRAAVEGHADEIRKCLAATGLSGRLVIRITVNPDGTVKAVDLMEATPKKEKARQCITGKVMKWRFPTPRDGREALVTISFAI